jgi:ElaB/YqjD/DUF883 family membrane-anchored ribosome-binding protein
VLGKQHSAEKIGMSAQSSSTQQLSREAEDARAALVHTVSELNGKVGSTIDQLKTSLAPAQIKQEMKSYVREEGSQIVSAIRRQASDNPLRAVAIGAAILYPFWGMLKSVPMPLFLIGGGLWLSNQKNAKVINDSASDGAKSAKDALSSAGASLHAMTDAIGETAHAVSDSAVSVADAAVAAIKEASEDALDTASATVSGLGETGSRAAEKSRTVFDHRIEKNPLLVGGLALGIGAFIAASLPRSSAEDRLFGEQSEGLKDKTVEAVNQGVTRAKDAAADIVGDIAAAAAREGLSREGVSKTIQGTASAIKSVVDRGLTTALGDEGGTPQSSGASRTNLN